MKSGSKKGSTEQRCPAPVWLGIQPVKETFWKVLGVVHDDEEAL